MSTTLIEKVFKDLTQNRIILNHYYPKGRQIQHQTIAGQ